MNTGYIREWLKPRLSEGRYLHSLGTEESAGELAIIFGVDPEKAEVAGLLHDNAKSIPYEDVLQVIKENNFYIEEDVKNNKKIVHAFVGACIAEKELNITDAEILNAIRYHTTGRPNMTMLDKVVFIADKIEANTREIEFREEVMNILSQTKDIDRVVLICVDRTIRSLLDRKLKINSQTIDVWNYYI